MLLSVTYAIHCYFTFYLRSQSYFGLGNELLSFLADKDDIIFVAGMAGDVN